MGGGAMSAVCSEPGCGAVLARNPRRKGTRCQRCAARTRVRSAEELAATGAKIRARYAEPGALTAHRARCRAAQIAAQARDPELLARRREQGRRNGRLHGNKGQTPERNAKISRTQTERYLGWCPLEYRDEYRRLVRNAGLKAADARAAIEVQIEADLQRYLRTGRLQRSGLSS